MLPSPPGHADGELSGQRLGVDHPLGGEHEGRAVQHTIRLEGVEREFDPRAQLMAFCDAELRSGVELALDALGADEVLEGAALVITAEGMLDAQTLAGKVPIGVARRARRHRVPVVAVGGAVAPMEQPVVQRFRDEGIVAVCPTAEGAATEEDLMDPDRTRQRLERTGERIARLVDL